MTKIKAPTNCPSCGSILQKVKDQLFCRNTECSAQSSKKIEHFCKKLKLKGFGPKTVEKLNLTSLTQLYSLTLEEAANAVGDKVASKLLSEIERATRLEFSALLAAFSIELLGDVAATKLAATVNSYEEISAESCSNAGLGDKVTANLLNWLVSEEGLECQALPIKVMPKSKSSLPEVGSKGDICITGKLNDFNSRSAAATYLAVYGYTVKASITKTVTTLICEDEGSLSSSSYKKALANGLTITTIKNLIKGDKI